MTTRNLHHLFRPDSIALIGASERPGSIGATVMRNLVAGGFSGPIYPVNPRYDHIAGTQAFRDVASLPRTPDLAVVATPPDTVPSIIRQLGERGTRAAVVLTAGLARVTDARGVTRTQEMLDASRPHLFRILGPNCVGLLIPSLGINASFAHTSAIPGNLAFVSQSGGLVTAVLDWARSREIGFSHFVSLGDSADIDFGDVIDYLASDPATHAILLYIESIHAARKFMSAARAAARNKPVLVVKAGRVPEGARAAASHTGALAGADDVYDAAIRRAGMLRVNTILELFDAVETLARAASVHGNRLAIMTNGGGPGVMATDALVRAGGMLAPLSDDIRRRLDEVLPPTWSHANPVDIVGDAPAQRYVSTLRALLDESNADAVLFIHVPTALVSAAEIARACVPVCTGRHVLSCWLGGDAVADARQQCARSGIATYATPEQAVAGFMQRFEYSRNQELLLQTPPSIPTDFDPDTRAARDIIEAALRSQREWLSAPEAQSILAAYGIPIAQIRVAADASEAARLAKEVGFPVALKMISPQITHKTEVGGVALDLDSEREVQVAAQAMAERMRKLVPTATLSGFVVQQMVRRPDAIETIVGAAVDPTFGPIVLFGHGGIAVEVIGDRAVALPPLDVKLAAELVARTRISRLFDGYRSRPPVNRNALHRVLTQVSQLVIDFAEIVELDVNPLLVDSRGVIALDARLRLAQTPVTGAQRLAIRPYPKELEEHTRFLGRDLLLRPIRPEDEPQHSRFLARVAPEDLQTRFFHVVRTFSHSQLARFTQIDYDREMAFIATAEGDCGVTETMGVVRAVTDPDGASAEFAILIRSDMKEKGLGTLLMRKMVEYCEKRGIGEMVGDVLTRNRSMLALARDLGFGIKVEADGATTRVRLRLGASER